MQLLEDHRAFERVIAEVDRQLKKEETPIADRPVRAIFEAGIHDDHKITYATVFGIGQPVETYAEQFAKRAQEWYLRQYGDQIKKDFSLGRKVIFIEDDLWILRIPNFLGRVEFVATGKRPSDKKPVTSSRPFVYNVVDSIEEMTDDRKSKLSDSERAFIYEKFVLGFESLSILHGCISQCSTIIKAMSPLSVDTPVRGRP